MEHITVLLQEAVDNLELNPDSIVVDATLGAGGHSRLIASKLGDKGHLIAIDADKVAVEEARDITSSTKAKVSLVNQNFSELNQILASLNVTTVDAILADLGWRTDQFTNFGRGFSFNDDTALTMTFGEPLQYLFTAHDIVNDWEEESLANIIFGYGEERQSRKIARAIVTAREEAPIETALQLSTIVASAMNSPRYKQRIHPATKTFQALRIAVNDELQVLESFIKDSFVALAPSGRLAIISFHSLEDRIVKHLFRSLSHDQKGELVNKKPITPATEECQANPRARSAKLRIIQKL